MREQQRDLPGLTIVRFFAAFAVLVYHFGLEQLKDAPTWAMNMALSGYIGVPFFFVLSGFILVYVSHGRGQSYREFIVRRIARIYPVYVLAWALYWIHYTYQIVSQDLPFTYWAKTSIVYGGSSLVLLQSWVPGLAQIWNGPAWSLSCEALFYLLFPLSFVTVGRLNSRTLWILLGALTVLNTVRFDIVQQLTHYPILQGTALHTTWGDYVYELPVLEFPVFLIGVVLGHLYLRNGAMPRAKLISAATIAAILFLMALTPKHYYFGIERDAYLAILFCVLIYSLASFQVMGQKVWVLLGQASYGVYILQIPVWNLMWMALGERTDVHRVGWELAAYFAVVIAFSCASFLWFERPVERLIKDRFSKPKASTLPAGRLGALDSRV